MCGWVGLAAHLSNPHKKQMPSARQKSINVQAELQAPWHHPSRAVKCSRLHVQQPITIHWQTTRTSLCCSERADGFHLLVVHVCKRTTTTSVQPHANTLPHSIHTQRHTHRLISSVLRYLLAGAFFPLSSGEITTLSGPIYPTSFYPSYPQQCGASSFFIFIVMQI